MAGNVRFCGASYWLANRKAEVQRTVNLYTAQAYDTAKGRDIRLDSIPGLVFFSDGDPGPGPGPGCRYVFLDNFNTEGEPVPITDHSQDIALLGSVWDVNDTTFWQLYDGKANSVEMSLMGNTTTFGGFSSGHPLMGWGWKFECDVEVPVNPPTEFAYVTCSGYSGVNNDLGSDTRAVEAYVRCATSGSGDVTIQVGEDSKYFNVTPGMHKFVLTMNETGMVATIDGVQVEVDGAPYVFTDTFRVPYSVGLWAQSLAPGTYMNVGMVGIYTCEVVGNWVYPGG